MSAILFPNGKQYYTLPTGVPMVGGKVYTYANGTSTPLTTWSDAAMTVPNTNPVILDARGEALIFWNGNYKVVLRDSTDNIIWTVDNVSAMPPDTTLRADLATTGGADMIGMAGGGTVQDYIDDPGSAGPIDANFSGIPFTNAAHWASAEFESNGATNGAWYSALQAGNNVTEAFSAGILVPSTATNHQTNGIGAYVRSERAQVGNGGDVAAYFQIVSAENNCAAFALNTVAQDTAGKTGQILGIELDYSVNAGDTEVNGINLVIVGNTPLSGNRNAVAVRGVFSANSKWSNAFVVDDGAVDSYAMLIGCTSSANNVSSQLIGIRSRTAGGTLQTSTVLADASGNLLIRPGAAASSVIIQAFDGSSNYVTMNANGITTPVLFLGLLTFAQLPSAASSAGARATISNSTTNTFNAIAAGGGANIVPVFSDGTNWRVG